MSNYRKTTSGTTLSIPGPSYNPYHIMMPVWRDIQLRQALFEGTPNLRQQLQMVAALKRELNDV